MKALSASPSGVCFCSPTLSGHNGLIILIVSIDTAVTSQIEYNDFMCGLWVWARDLLSIIPVSQTWSSRKLGKTFIHRPNFCQPLSGEMKQVRAMLSLKCMLYRANCSSWTKSNLPPVLVKIAELNLTSTVWLTKSETFPIWSLTEKICWLLIKSKILIMKE